MSRPTGRSTGATRTVPAPARVAADRRARVRRAATALALGALALVAACSGDEAEPTVGGPSSSAAATTEPEVTTTPVEPTEEPTPADEGVVDRSDDTTGLQLVNLPELTGEEAAVVNAYTQFQTEYWHTRRTNTISETALASATPTGLLALEERISVQTAEAATLGGAVTLAPRLEFVEGDVAAVSACVDETEVLAIFANETVPALSLGGHATHRGYADLTKESGTWRVSSYTVQTEECTP